MKRYNGEMIIMMGNPGSGKSYFINNNLLKSNNGHQVICRDDLRKIYPKYPDHEPIVRTIAESMCRALLQRNLNVVIDETNLITHKLKYWTEIAKQYDYKTYGILIDTDVDICIERRKETNFPIDIVKTMNTQLNIIKEEGIFETIFDNFTIINGITFEV